MRGAVVSSREHCTRANEATGLVCDISGSRSSIAEDVTLCRWANGFATFRKLTVVRLLDSEDEGVRNVGNYVYNGTVSRFTRLWE